MTSERCSSSDAVMKRPCATVRFRTWAKFGVAPIILVFSMVRLPLRTCTLWSSSAATALAIFRLSRSRSYSSMVTSGRFWALIQASSLVMIPKRWTRYTLAPRLATRSATYMFSPAMTLITETSVVTAKMTPSKVRKLRNLCARSASRASQRVSRKVTNALRRRTHLAALSIARVSALGIALNPSIGVTPNQTSNLLYLRRVDPSNRSLIYRRAGEHFAIGAFWSSLTPGRFQSQQCSGRTLHCTALFSQPGEEAGAPGPQDSTSQGGRHAPYLPLFSYTYSTFSKLYAVRPRSGQPRP